jgi:aspartate dehydrogenase
MPKLIGIIGCGTIGTELAIAMDNGRVKNVSVIVLFDTVKDAAESLRVKLQNHNPSTYYNFEEFVSSSSFNNTDIIIEAASQDALQRQGKTILQNGKSLMIMSVGALADSQFLSELVDTAAKNLAHIYIPTGAIAGIDAIRSVRTLLDSVILTTTKGPRALADAPFFDDAGINVNKIINRTLIYEGTANDAVKKFPSNINVAAVLSLAGVGIEKTIVKIIIDPSAITNRHEIVATGKFGEIKISVDNIPSMTNPKTSFLAILSAIECLSSICNGVVRIGT